ncbi:HCL348Cp [Eremothecium sinecaudum]|uniref:Succinate-semialdehyde dehydrogenase n=1 Tax=Eremothecium sinecaudum TaxID=45286 RepID=A0A109UYA4_9SACH|nr:HCL348Cp [Eremothecium sinecaudum]AMD19803.1 HCL348Cp [Eremothecium sinecaudum]
MLRLSRFKAYHIISRAMSIRPTFANESLFEPAAFIDGKWVKSAEEYFEVSDPATGEVIATLPDQGVNDVNHAIECASKAFASYKNVPHAKRAQLLRNLYNLMMENVEDLGKLITWENGKPLADAIGEVKYAASFFDWYAGEAVRIYGTTIPVGFTRNRAFTIRQPVGVCGIICPWNFPAAMITRKAGAALAAGCTVVIKPDAQTPLSALALAQLAAKAGFPPGTINVVLTLKRVKEIGLALCKSPLVSKISFTGSTAVGKILAEQSASTLKKLSLELGGNAPLIVFEDADIDQAVDQAIATKFRNLGQTCICANRLYVHRAVIDEFTEKIAAKIRKFKFGHGLQPDVTHGCLINTAAVAKVEAHVEDAIKRGATVVVKGGRMPELGDTFYFPTVLTNVDPEARLTKEETFGPLCAIIPFDSVEQVVEYANNTRFGLASYVFSKNIETIYTVAETLQSGMVSCNTGVFSECPIPFGGIKESGYGREGSLHGIEDYTNIKTIAIGNISRL